MAVDRDQVRRNAEKAIRDAFQYRPLEGQQLAVKATDALHFLLAELEQAEQREEALRTVVTTSVQRVDHAERQRDESVAEVGRVKKMLQQQRHLRVKAEARLAKVPALVEAGNYMMRLVPLTKASGKWHEAVVVLESRRAR